MMAGLLGGAANRLADKIADFEARTGLEMALAMIESLQGASLEEFSLQLARHWKMARGPCCSSPARSTIPKPP